LNGCTTGGFIRRSQLQGVRTITNYCCIHGEVKGQLNSGDSSTVQFGIQLSSYVIFICYKRKHRAKMQETIILRDLNEERPSVFEDIILSEYLTIRGRKHQ
jgi:hypothetical protein